MRAITQIRSTAITKANRLQKCHRHIEELAPAFAEWAEGEIYVCKKTGTYRYRFGDRSKSVTPWDVLVRRLFPTVADFAFAAVVLGTQVPALAEIAPVPTPAQPRNTGRVNIVALAAA